VEEAAAGIRQYDFVTGRNKRAIEDHFDTAYYWKMNWKSHEAAQ
jgi:UTP-glucose-1-phosphate uridylyltransferase